MGQFSYRNLVNRHSGLRALNHRHTHILIHGEPEMEDGAVQLGMEVIRKAYVELDQLIRQAPEFATSFCPWTREVPPGIADAMVRASCRAGVGPMAAVAGAMADQVLLALDNGYSFLAVENGGDTSLTSQRDVRLALYPGWHRGHSTLHVVLPPGTWGVATSSGRLGRSASLGKATSVTVVARSGVLADAHATALANQFKPGCEPERFLDFHEDLHAVAFWWQGRFHYRGPFPLEGPQGPRR